MPYTYKKKPYTFGNAVLDVILTVVTGGAWLIWIVIRFLRTH